MRRKSLYAVLVFGHALQKKFQYLGAQIHRAGLGGCTEKWSQTLPAGGLDGDTCACLIVCFQAGSPPFNFTHFPSPFRLGSIRVEFRIAICCMSCFAQLGKPRRQPAHPHSTWVMGTHIFAHGYLWLHVTRAMPLLTQFGARKSMRF